MSNQNIIKVLDKLTANQIAAGEVIETPSSVVKELVENSIDAGSTQIIIKADRGGIDRITVQDNGFGMSKSDLALAFERHATSKISTAKDLDFIYSLGFRGEALPSIASVSKVEATSKTSDSMLGWQLCLEDGVQKSFKEVGCNTGTTIIINDLFYNTPARKKYLKSPLSEMSSITNIVSKLALAFPHISFSLISNGIPVIATPGNDSLIDVIVSLWGLEIEKNLMQIS
ncbi:MAG: DNA mismatch repair endonuclease MutL, partial [Bacillota bacterium]|nr:DNA mismatch repair endonuclease MutL [Bacillota bacterium]